MGGMGHGQDGGLLGDGTLAGLELAAKDAISKVLANPDVQNVGESIRQGALKVCAMCCLFVPRPQRTCVAALRLPRANVRAVVAVGAGFASCVIGRVGLGLSRSAPLGWRGKVGYSARNSVLCDPGAASAVHLALYPRLSGYLSSSVGREGSLVCATVAIGQLNVLILEHDS